MGRRREREVAAAAWALTEVEGQLRAQPAHQLTGAQEETQEWSFTAPNGVAVYVEAQVVEASLTEAEVRVSARLAGLLSRVELDRRFTLPLTGDAARVPDSLYLVFETDGHVSAFETLEEAGASLESWDLESGHYVGAFSDRGEAITMTPGDLWITFTPSGSYDSERLSSLIRESRHAKDFHNDPHHFALALWLST